MNIQNNTKRVYPNDIKVLFFYGNEKVAFYRDSTRRLCLSKDISYLSDDEQEKAIMKIYSTCNEILNYMTKKQFYQRILGSEK